MIFKGIKIEYKQSRRAFSLIEMMVVLLVVSIIAGATVSVITSKRSTNSNVLYKQPAMSEGFGNNVSGTATNARVVMGTQNLPNPMPDGFQLLINNSQNNVGTAGTGVLFLKDYKYAGELRYIGNSALVMGADSARNINNTNANVTIIGHEIANADSTVTNNVLAVGYGLSGVAEDSVTIGANSRMAKRSIVLGSHANFGLKNNNITNNILIGDKAGSNDTATTANWSRNIYIGLQAGANKVVGNGNVGIGTYVENHNSRGSNNIMLGTEVATNMTTADENIIVGYKAGSDITRGGCNIIVGYSAGSNITYQWNMIAIGHNAMHSIYGEPHVAIGAYAMNNHGSYTSLAIGYAALSGVLNKEKTFELDADNAWGNCALGSFALSMHDIPGKSISIEEMGENIAIGSYAMAYGNGATSLTNNVAIGYKSLPKLSRPTLQQALCVGSNTCTNIDIPSVIAIGYGVLSGVGNTKKTLKNDVVLIGSNIMSSGSTHSLGGTVVIGSNAHTNPGYIDDADSNYANTIIGAYAATHVKHDNTIIGYGTANTKGGDGAFYLGYKAGTGVNSFTWSNHFIGTNAGSYSNIDWQYVTCIGNNACSSSSTTAKITSSDSMRNTYQISDGHPIVITANAVRRHNGKSTFEQSSDIRLKNIKSKSKLGLNEIKKINVYNFTYNKKLKYLDRSKKKVGVIAQELQKIIPQAVIVSDTKEKYLSVNIDPVFYAMLNAIKELDLIAQNVVAEYKELKQNVKILVSDVINLDKTIDKVSQDQKSFDKEIEEMNKRLAKLERNRVKK